MSDSVTVNHGDSREVLRGYESDSFDSCATDPPYALVSIGKRFGKDGAAPAKGNSAYMRASAGFMGQQWDTGETAFDPEFWREVLRVLKPGAHLVAFSGTRTYHRTACAIEDAGFEIRDQLQWLYGSGFPKSHDVSKGIDKALGCERSKVRVDASTVRNPKVTGAGRDGTVGATRPWIESAMERGFHEAVSDEAVSDEAVNWRGWGTALKPACEPIVLARKPLSEKTVAANVLRWGTGALNIDGCRVGEFTNTTPAGTDRYNQANFEQGYRPCAYPSNGREGEASADRRYTERGSTNFAATPGPRGGSPQGRWPANIVHDGSDEVLAEFPSDAGAFAPVRGTEPSNSTTNVYGERDRCATFHHGDRGSAARFFYTAKADSDDRLGSSHPTVKPVDLMQWLVRLVTRKGGLVLDPFAGTGTTGEACIREGMRAVLIEREERFVADIRRRMALALSGPDERSRESVKAKIAAGRLKDDPGPLFGGSA